MSSTLVEAQALPAGLATMPPGPELGIVLASIDLARCASSDLFTVLAAEARQKAHHDARLMTAMAECAYAERADAARVTVRRGEPDGPEDAAGLSRIRELDDLCADQVSFTLHCSRTWAAGQIFLAHDLLQRLPAVYKSWFAGRICVARAAVFSDVLHDLPDQVIARLLDRFLVKAEEWTPGHLRERLTFHANKADPSRVRRRYQATVAQRRVYVQPFTDGTAQLGGINLPPDHALAAFNRVDRIARAAKSKGDPRNLDQLRADAMLDLLSGRPFTDTGMPTPDPLTAEADQEQRDEGLGDDDPRDLAGPQPPSPPVHRPGYLQRRTKPGPRPGNRRATSAAAPRPTVNDGSAKGGTAGPTASANGHGAGSTGPRPTNTRTATAGGGSRGIGGNSQAGTTRVSASNAGPDTSRRRSVNHDNLYADRRNPGRGAGAGNVGTGASPAAGSDSSDRGNHANDGPDSGRTGRFFPDNNGASRYRPDNADTADDGNAAGGRYGADTRPTPPDGAESSDQDDDRYVTEDLEPIGTAAFECDLATDFDIRTSLDPDAPLQPFDTGPCRAEPEPRPSGGTSPPAEPGPRSDPHIHPAARPVPRPEPEPSGDPDLVPVASDDPRMCVCGGVQPAARRGVVDVQVQLTTLMRLNNNPGYVPGWGPVLAEIARKIAEDEDNKAAWKVSVTDPGGVPTLNAPLRRRPTAAVKAFVHARDTTCQAPGPCRTPATTSDMDHRKPWAEHGPSQPSNLDSRCAHHHKLRHEHGYEVFRMPDGTSVWQAPNGLRYSTPPEDTLRLSTEDDEIPAPTSTTP